MFDYWMRIEKQFNIRSTFYIYSNIIKYKSLKSWLIDPSYNISKNINLQIKLISMLKEGFQIGLHGSYYSAKDPELLRKERDQLSFYLKHEITHGRQHWLNYYESITPYSHENLFQTDATIGWNDIMGFRAGIASQYRPYDHLNQRAFNYYCIPQVLMDSQFFDYKNEWNSIAHAKRIIDNANHYSNMAHYYISWNPRTAHNDYQWHYIYEELLEYTQNIK
jgi:hypothetical protein